MVITWQWNNILIELTSQFTWANRKATKWKVATGKYLKWYRLMNTHTHTKRFASLHCRLQFYFPLHELHISYCLCVTWLWFWRATTRYETCAPTQIHGINITKNNSNNNKFHRNISVQPDSSSLSKVKCVCVFIKFNVLPHTCEKALRRKKCWYKIPQWKADEKEKEIWRSFYSIMGSLPFFSFLFYCSIGKTRNIQSREVKRGNNEKRCTINTFASEKW